MRHRSKIEKKNMKQKNPILGSKNHCIYSVVWTAPSKNTGICAFFIMLQEVICPCKSHKTPVNYTAISWIVRQRGWPPSPLQVKLKVAPLELPFVTYQLFYICPVVRVFTQTDFTSMHQDLCQIDAFSLSQQILQIYQRWSASNFVPQCLARLGQTVRE